MGKNWSLKNQHKTRFACDCLFHDLMVRYWLYDIGYKKIIKVVIRLKLLRGKVILYFKIWMAMRSNCPRYNESKQPKFLEKLCILDPQIKKEFLKTRKPMRDMLVIQP